MSVLWTIRNSAKLKTLHNLIFASALGGGFSGPRYTDRGNRDLERCQVPDCSACTSYLGSHTAAWSSPLLVLGTVGASPRLLLQAWVMVRSLTLWHLNHISILGSRVAFLVPCAYPGMRWVLGVLSSGAVSWELSVDFTSCPNTSCH